MLDIAQDIKKAIPGKTHLFFLGQAGFVIKNALGKLLGIDLYLSDCVMRYDGFKRNMPFTILPGEIEFDYLITTHAHYDHFDPDSIPALLSGTKTKLFASFNCRKEIRKLDCNSKRITYVQSGDQIDLEGFKLDIVFCDHGESAPDAFGVIIHMDGRLIYITGDTCLRLDKAEDIKGERTFDIMIAPINGTFGNMNEVDAAELCRELEPRLFIPCHFGCFAEQWGALGQLSESIRTRTPDQMYYVMRIGECLTL